MIGDLTHHLVHFLDSPSVAPCSNLCCCWTPKSVCGCCLFLFFFFFLGGGHIFAFRPKIRKRTSYKNSKIREKEFNFIFQKLKLKIKDEKDRTKTDRYMKATPKNRVRVIAVSCLIDRTFSAVGNTAFLFKPAKGGKKKKNKEKEKE